MSKEVEHDEHQFVAAGQLLAAQGLLPYRDYAYNHTPNLALSYALLFSFTRWLILGARSFSVACGLLTLGLIFAETRAAFGSVAERPQGAKLQLLSLISGPAVQGVACWIAGASAVLILLTNPLFTYTSGWAWNHDAATSLALLAFVSLRRGVWPSPARRWMVAAGAALGLAIGTRLTFVPLLAPFMLVVLIFPRSSARRQRVRALAWLALGLLGGLLPTMGLAALAPRQFWFGNVGYAALNTLFRQETGYDRAMTLAGKLEYLGHDVIWGQPGNLVILLALGGALLLAALHPGVRRASRPELWLAALMLPFLLAGSLAPTPAWPQYFYAPIPFMVMGIIYAMAAFASQSRRRGPAVIALAALALLSVATGAGPYRAIGILATPEQWVPVQIHRVGAEMKGAAGSGKVLTLAPTYPLEGGLTIYTEFATGAFEWRVAPLVPVEERRALKLVAKKDLAEFLAADPPRGILVRFEEHAEVEKPFSQYAERNGYRAVTLTNGKTLWVAPSQN
jgi:hypothetical protein